MPKNKKKKSYKCRLFPYKVQPVLSIQDAKQKCGWGITAFNLPDAWKHTNGEGVVVAVLDTGSDLSHSDLKNNLLPGINFINPRKKPWDDNQHGTHVAGIIAAEHNDIGMVGVAPKCKIIPVKVLNGAGDGDLRTVSKGIRWAAQKADIICMSLGAPQPVQEIRKAIQYAAKKNVPCFVAAGNAGHTKEVFYPAAYPETIAIGSINANFDRSNFSNTGKNLDFLAPGGAIFSTIPDNWYAILSGTSMACPFAVGVAALVLSYARKNNLKISLNTVEDYRRLFRENTISTKDKRYAGQKFFEGFGIIDPRQFVEYLKQHRQ